jgi:hypothetical protein
VRPTRTIVIEAAIAVGVVVAIELVSCRRLALLGRV